MNFRERILTSFPLPKSVVMPAVGLDISDRSVKFLELIPAAGGEHRVGRFANLDLPAGIIERGEIVDKKALVTFLRDFRRKYGLTFVRASLPEEPAYIFTTNVPDVSPDEIRSLLAFKLEEHVPLAPADAVIDFDRIVDMPTEGIERALVPEGHRTVAVSVFPEAIARDYAELLEQAGLAPVSLEIEAQGIARSVIPAGATDGCMVIDVGSTRCGITIVGGGAVRFTTTVPLGGEMLQKTIRAAFPDISQEEIVAINNEKGLLYRKEKNIAEAFELFAQDLCAEIDRYFLYWQGRTDIKDRNLPEHPIRKIFLSGGYANIKGLSDRISRELRVPAKRADVWVNAFSTGDYIPPISYENSLGYASAIGLALRRDY